MKIQPTHEDIIWTSDKVVEQASIIQGKPMRLFSEIWQCTKLMLLGRKLECSKEDNMRQVVFEGTSWIPKRVDRRRVGKPREQWVGETLSEAFDERMKDEWIQYEAESEEHQEILLEGARSREGIFIAKAPNESRRTPGLAGTPPSRPSRPPPPQSAPSASPPASPCGLGRCCLSSGAAGTVRGSRVSGLPAT